MNAIQTFQSTNVGTVLFRRPDINKMYYEIVHNEVVYGTLENVAENGTLARITVENDTYMVKRKGFFKPYMTIRKQNLEKIESIVFLNLTGHSKLSFEGTELNFRTHQIWKNQWAWVNEKNQVVIKYKPMTVGNHRGEIEITKDFLYLEHLELFAVIGWFFLTQLEQELEQINEIKVLK